MSIRACPSVSFSYWIRSEFTSPTNIICLDLCRSNFCSTQSRSSLNLSRFRDGDRYTLPIITDFLEFLQLLIVMNRNSPSVGGDSKFKSIVLMSSTEQTLVFTYVANPPPRSDSLTGD